MKKLLSVLFAGVLAACNASSSNSAGDTTDDGKPMNVVTVDISGRVNKRIEARGDAAGLGYMKFTKTEIDLFTITAAESVEAGPAYEATSGVSIVQLTLGEQVFAGTLGTGGSVRVEEGESTKDYNGGNYWLFFDTDVDHANSKVHLTLTDITDIGDYVRLTGSFRYNAAYAPSELSDECVLDAVRNSGRQPGYNAQLCEAEDIKVNATFTVYLDKILQKSE
ncbi:hypothetical protein AKJ09_00775 [Labilithrix luteola]|uniref:Lipoprotein n=1 Tax=Labilithrix luteola TaxID=1391654 RepID=A0A0K1PL19_9BACT|nr:hypothetical protein [Labilithrix luteola]AKU94111.1 hypothetical protein AKJ09_00775 [Labilithrix luteola]